MVGTARKVAQQPERVVIGSTAAQAHVARRELLHHITNFLLDLELDVGTANLTLAYEVISGANPGLSQQIVARQLASEPVTQAWLDDVISEAELEVKKRAAAAERETLSPLMSKLEESLHLFAQSASLASDAAKEYHAALGETATSLEAARPIVEIPGLTELTTSMLDRTRIVEEDMHRREEDAARLRDTLQVARADTAMDQLAGVDNPRDFDAMMKREVRAARDAGEPLSIALCGIDRFDAINDTHGRDTGFRLIEALARGLRRVSGQSCHVARHGHEQFVLLFRGISAAQASQQLDEARQEFARRKLINRETGIAIGTVTFSGGVADVSAYADPQLALKAAGEALSQAREQGYNQILSAAPIR